MTKEPWEFRAYQCPEHPWWISLDAGEYCPHLHRIDDEFRPVERTGDPITLVVEPDA